MLLVTALENSQDNIICQCSPKPLQITVNKMNQFYVVTKLRAKRFRHKNDLLGPGKDHGLG